MAAQEFDNLPTWMQLGVGLMLGFGTVGAMIVRFFGGKTAPEPPKHVVVEQAELADMSLIRMIAPKLDEVLRLATAIDDLRECHAATEARQERMLEILGRMDRKEEMRALIREERRTNDERGDPRR